MPRIARAGRRTRQSKTAVWYERARVGTLTRATDGAIAFTYDPDWVASEAAFPVASALPLTRLKWQGDPVVAAFDNLLPDAEGELREKIAARAGAQGKDVFSLLSVLGRDVVGALQFLPLDEAPSEQDMQYRVISEEEMVADLKNLAAAPLALGDDEDFRISIAGSQEKTAYLRINGQWAKPRGITPTRRERTVLHDLCAGNRPARRTCRKAHPSRAGRAVGRTVRPCLARRHPEAPTARGYLPVTRLSFCHEIPEAGRPRRRADHGAFAGIRHAHRGPGDVLPGADLLLPDRRTLAPLYDILSVAPVVRAGRLQRKRYRLAMSIDGHYGIDEIVPRHFEAEGRAAGLPKGRALELLQDMTDRLGPALERTLLAVGDHVPAAVSEPIAGDAMERAAQMRDLL